MLDSLKAEFDKRKSQITNQIGYIKLIEDFWGAFDVSFSTPKTSRKNVEKFRGYLKDITFLSVLKSQVIIMIYNLLEYTINELLREIYAEYSKHNYDVFLDELGLVFVKNFKNAMSDRNQPELKTFIESFLNLKIPKDNYVDLCYKSLCNGWRNPWQSTVKNLGYKTIVDWTVLKEIMTEYKIPIPSQWKKSKLEHLEALISHRNKLTHGVNSFLEIWKIVTSTDIENYITELWNYHLSIISNVEDYLSVGSFKRIP